MVEFAGFELPVQYTSILAEHRHTRTACSLFDTCHMGMIEIPAKHAELLAAAITVDATALKVGRGKYGFILNVSGGVIDDVILMKPSDDTFLLVVNAATAANDVAVIQDRLGDPTAARYRDDWGKLDVQGPQSWSILDAFVDFDLSELGYFGCRFGQVCGVDAVISRTGYTGELGYEIFCDAAALPPIMDSLLEEPTVQAAGLGSRDSLRLEMGYALYGHELNEQTTPLEASLGFAIDLDGEFVGVEVLRQQKSDGLSRKLVALKTEGRRPFHDGCKIMSGGEAVGVVTSGAFSPSLNCAIGMGFVQPKLAEVGTELTLCTERAEIAATVAPLPQYKNGTCRKSITS